MTAKRFFKVLAVAGVAVLTLSGCESTKGAFAKMSWPQWGSSGAVKTAAGTCPQVSLMPDLGNIAQLRNKQLVSETIFENITPACSATDSAATVRLAINFKGRLGPEGVKDAAVEANYSLPYLVAVINPKGEIISKDIFAITLTYKKGQTEQSYADLLEQSIPLQKAEKATDYKIMLGFQLTDEELAYNRSVLKKP